MSQLAVHAKQQQPQNQQRFLAVHQLPHNAAVATGRFTATAAYGSNRKLFQSLTS